MNNTTRLTSDSLDVILEEIRQRRRELGETPERATARTAAFKELRRLHPDHYVAYRELWDGARLIEPFLLATSTDLADLEREVEKLPDEIRSAARIRFVSAHPILFSGISHPRSDVRKS